jgi:hypothetical protein
MSATFTTPVVLVLTRKRSPTSGARPCNCFRAERHQRVMYRRRPREHTRSFTGKPLFGQDEDGALLLVDTHGIRCAVTVEYQRTAPAVTSHR